MAVMWKMSLSSFKGIVAWASHYRVSLAGRVEDVTVEYLMNSKDAKALSEPDFTYKTGDLSERFFSRDDAIAAGTVAWRALAAEDDVLCLGDDSSPNRAIAGPDEVVAQINALSERFRLTQEVTYAAWDAFLAAHFEPHLHDTVFGYGAPPSVRQVVEVTLRHEDDGWVVDEIEWREKTRV